MAFLEIKIAGGRTHKFPLREGKNIVGSGPKAQIHLDDPLVAPVQADITLRSDGQGVIRNLATDRAIYLNNNIVTGEGTLKQGDHLIFGSTRCAFFNVDLDSTREVLELASEQELKKTAADRATATLLAPPPAPVIDPPFTEKDLETHPYLEVCRPGLGARLIPLREGESLVGLAPECGIRLDDPAIDQRHAKLIRKADGIFAVDMGSSSGIFVNDKRIFREPLKDKDVLQLGHSIITFRQPRPPKVEPAPTVAEVQAPGQAPARRSAPIPWGRIALFGGAGLVVVVLVAIAGYFGWKALHRQPVPDERQAQAQFDNLMQTRQWDKAREFIEKGTARLPADKNENYLDTIRREVQSQRFAQDCRQALASGQTDMAMSDLSQIPADSVYREDTVKTVITALDQAVDIILQRDNPAPEDFPKIIVLAEKMLQVIPNYAPAMSYICLARLAQGDLGATLKAASDLVARHPQLPTGYYYQALVHYQAKRYTEALAAVNEALRFAPDTLDFLLLRAKTEILLDRLEAARVDLSKVLDRRPKDETAQALYNRLTGKATPAALPKEPTARSAGLRELRHAHQQAAGAAQTAGKANPPPAGSSEQIRQLYQEGKDLEGQDLAAAVVKWEQMRALEQAALGAPRSVYTQEVAPKVADFLANRAALDLREGQLGRAFTLSSKALQWAPNHAQAASIRKQVDDTAGNYYIEGFREYQKGNAQSAREYWEKIIRTVDDSSKWYRQAKEKIAELEEQGK